MTYNGVTYGTQGHVSYITDVPEFSSSESREPNFILHVIDRLRSRQFDGCEFGRLADGSYVAQKKSIWTVFNPHHMSWGVDVTNLEMTEKCYEDEFLSHYHKTLDYFIDEINNIYSR